MLYMKTNFYGSGPTEQSRICCHDHLTTVSMKTGSKYY